MGSEVTTPATYRATCDLCGHVDENQPVPVPEGWAQVAGPTKIPGPPVPRKVLLCTGCYTHYKEFWHLS